MCGSQKGARSLAARGGDLKRPENSRDDRKPVIPREHRGAAGASALFIHKICG
jgi:hypothetical protein